MLLLEAEAAVAQLDPLNDILREEQVLGGSGASAGPGRQPLHGQEPSELLFSFQSLRPQQKETGEL